MGGWDKGEPTPKGHIVDVLGMPGENDTEMHAILAEYALPYGSSRRWRTPPTRFLEEFMLLANRRVAEFCGRSKAQVGRTMVCRPRRTERRQVAELRQFIHGSFGHVQGALRAVPSPEMNSSSRQL